MVIASPDMVVVIPLVGVLMNTDQQQFRSIATSGWTASAKAPVEFA